MVVGAVRLAVILREQESPHGAGFPGVFPVMWEHVETCIWLSRGDLNPKAQIPSSNQRFGHLAPES